MGLLDDAIREHLELKRRGGADPSAVARAEHEALAPVFPSESVDAGDDREGAAHESGQARGDDAYDVPTDAHAQLDAPDAHLSTPGQETAELDMQAVMAEDAPTAPAPNEPLVDGRETAARTDAPVPAAGHVFDDARVEEAHDQEHLPFE